MVLWKGKKHWQSSGQTYQEEREKNPNKLNKKWKKKSQGMLHKYTHTHTHTHTNPKWIQLYANKFENLEEKDNFLETYSLSKLNQEQRDQVKRQITGNEIEYVIKTVLTKKSSGLYSFTGEFYQTYKEELIHILLQKFEEEGTIPKIVYEDIFTLIPKPDKDTTKKEN